MDAATRKILDELYSNNANTRYESFAAIKKLAREPVDWAYELWDDMLVKLKEKDNHWRAIAAQLLCSFAKSDPQRRMLKDIDAVIAVTKGEKFVTARHSLMSLWKVGVVDKELQHIITGKLAGRFIDCVTEKNCTLVRFDIIEVLRKMYYNVQDDGIKKNALELIETEEDLKYKKKYLGLWMGLK